MSVITPELTEIINDPGTIKLLTTTSEDGKPHPARKQSLTALENGTLAYMELLETSQTMKNMVWSVWWQKEVSILIINDAKNCCCEIKGVPYRLHHQGSLWDTFLDQIWKIIPTANPAGVWEINPKQVIDQNFEASARREAERLPMMPFWSHIYGPRP